MPTLNWIGKEKIVNFDLDVPYHVLDKKYSFNCDDSDNMIIHGDNLIALKSLLPKYQNKINCIYIDPPYNTGKKEGQWVYSDNVNDPHLKEWFNNVVGVDGDEMSRHDKWLCMMYPRLKTLRKLLSEDGVILISINDYEYANLKAICDEIFGLNNFVKNFIWYIDGHTDNQDDITTVHEYILCYAKNIKKLDIQKIVDPNTPEDSKILNSFAENSITKNGFKNPPVMIELPAGFPCEAEKISKNKHENVEELILEASRNGFITREMTKKYNMSYPARIDDLNVNNYKLLSNCRVYSGWMNNGKLIKFINNKFEPIEDDGSKIKFYLSKNGVIYYRRDGRENHYVQTVLEHMGTTETNKYMLESMGIKFTYPKPVELIKYLLSIFTKENSLILDCFAGSGTTMHAAFELNAEDKKNRKCICIERMNYAETGICKRIENIITGYNDVKGCGGNFSFFEIGNELFENDKINENVNIESVKDYIFYTATTSSREKTTSSREKTTYQNKFILGIKENTAYYFYYEKNRKCVLNDEFLKTIDTKTNNYVIFADSCTLSKEELTDYHITFKKTPRDITRF